MSNFWKQFESGILLFLNPLHDSFSLRIVQKDWLGKSGSLTFVYQKKYETRNMHQYKEEKSSQPDNFCNDIRP